MAALAGRATSKLLPIFFKNNKRFLQAPKPKLSLSPFIWSLSLFHREVLPHCCTPLCPCSSIPLWCLHSTLGQAVSAAAPIDIWGQITHPEVPLAPIYPHLGSGEQKWQEAWCGGFPPPENFVFQSCDSWALSHTWGPLRTGFPQSNFANSSDNRNGLGSQWVPATRMDITGVEITVTQETRSFYVDEGAQVMGGWLLGGAGPRLKPNLKYTVSTVPWCPL
jgi:hypothetical protein